jgi:hypothetical protein
MTSIPPMQLAADLRAIDLLTACAKRGGPFPSITEMLDAETVQRRATMRRGWIAAGFVIAALAAARMAGVV